MKTFLFALSALSVALVAPLSAHADDRGRGSSHVERGNRSHDARDRHDNRGGDRRDYHGRGDHRSDSRSRYYSSRYYGRGYGSYRPYGYGYGYYPGYIGFYSRPSYYYDVRPSTVYYGNPAYYSSSVSSDVQRELRERGYYHGGIDGDIGPASRAAIRSYRVDRGLPVTSAIDSRLLDSLGLD